MSDRQMVRHRYHTKMVRMMLDKCRLAAADRPEADINIFSAILFSEMSEYFNAYWKDVHSKLNGASIPLVSSTGSLTTPLASGVIQTLRYAENEAESMGLDFIGMGHLLLSLLAQGDKGIFNGQNIQAPAVRDYFLNWYRLHSVGLEEQDTQ